MPIVSLFSWWYGDGWLRLARYFAVSVRRSLSMFSVGLLLATLFSPFRQIAVGNVRGSLDAQLHAWMDLQISRLVGAFVRLGVIVAGISLALITLVVGVVVTLAWPLLPAMPLLLLIITIGVTIK